MAEQSQNPGAVTNTFNKGMVKDMNETFVGEGLWTHARNLVNNTHDGNMGVVSNEPANLKCVELPYDLIGAIHIVDDIWAVYTTDDVSSEIGLFDESKCTYTKVVNDPCLNFRRSNLITGASRKRYDCQFPVYWADGLNPDRFADLGNIPYKCKKKLVSSNTQDIPAIFSYTIINPSVEVTPESNVIKGVLTFDCDDSNCTQQGSTGIKFQLEQPAPIGGLTVKFGWLDGAGSNVIIPMAYGQSGMYNVPVGYTPSSAPYDQPLSVTIPEGQTTFYVDKVIRSTFVNPSTGQTIYDVWTCQNCQTPLQAVYVKSNTPNYYVEFTSSQNVSVHNLDTPTTNPVNTQLDNSFTISYKDIDGIQQAGIQVRPGEVKTICAYENTVLASKNTAQITKGASCVSIEDSSCYIKECTDQLDCEKLRLAPLAKVPCINLSIGKVGGSLPNGSYQAAIAYSEKGIRLTSFLGMSEVQGVFTHQNVSSSLELSISDLDQQFDEFQLVIIARINGTTVAKKIGTYSTAQGTIFIDRWDQEFETVRLTDVIVRTEASEKSDAIYEVNNYLLKVGDYSKFKFNYQKQANRIQTEWVAVEYPADYYRKGGNNAGYLRDEQYAYFIRFIYNTGDRSDSYHIPGRAPEASDRVNVFGQDAFETTGATPVQRERWQVENTGSLGNTATYTLSDGGVVIASGKMGYWESTERYPDNQPEIWGDLCGKNIRHHKIPDETVHPLLNTFKDDGEKIIILGVQFSGITHPLDNHGNPIESIVGYEILRGSREGNKTILAKGLFNNMREYTIPNNTTQKGLYVNYPYNDLGPDKFLTSDRTIINKGSFDNNKSNPLTGYRNNIFSFHSPEVTFSNPFLSVQEVKMYQEYYGKSQGYFEHPYRHPRHKFISRNAEIIGKIKGIMDIISKLKLSDMENKDIMTQATEDLPITINLVPKKPEKKNTILGGIVGAVGNLISPGLGTALQQGIDTAAYAIDIAAYVAQSAVIAWLHTEVTHAQLQTIMYGLIPRRQYALQYNSHGFYNKSAAVRPDNKRRKIKDAIYIGNAVHQLNKDYLINNKNRTKTVIIELEQDILKPVNTDNSRALISESGYGINTEFQRNISSYYGGIKISMPSQYGQLDGIKQMVISGGCLFTSIPDKTKTFQTPVLFGGDTYINRFTEKNSMLFFTDWMIGEPDETEWDYRNYMGIAYPRYWMDTQKVEYKLFKSTADYHHFDYQQSRFFYIHRGYIYLFSSGVKDFFVESEINLAYRDWEDVPAKDHYDTFRNTDLQSMFRSDIIKSGNLYKYDYNLSVSKLFNSHITWGNILGRDYDPITAETCYTYSPSRVRYSLPQNLESRKDNWRIFLPNNFKDFDTPVTSIKPVNRTGALFMMARQSPMQFMGVEELKMDATGAKITIGDGALFNQPLQFLTNAETSFEYGSCQSRYAVMNTVHGLFWVSQNQGKIFQYAGQLDEISRMGMKWWLAKYLPSQLLKVYPDFPLYDNPVVGVGVQMIYDNTHELLYITKKDYVPKRDNLRYDSGGFYYVSGTTQVSVPGFKTCPEGYSYQNGTCVKITQENPGFVNGEPTCNEGFILKQIGQELICEKVETAEPGQTTITQNIENKVYVSLKDPAYFEDCSWTLSYDPKMKSWVSFHDWHPTFVIPGKQHFMTVNGDSIWKHNERCDLFCNFYGKDYPFDIEFVSATGQTVTSVRNVEYLLEAYKYYNNCADKFHILDENFDQAMIYNSEQVSGLLELELKDKTNPWNMLNYPQVTGNTVKINYSKEENKYKFNQFWDITKDRGEFSGAKIPMFNTEPNGYEYSINPQYVDYNKSSLERKKFRHNVNRVFLRKFVSGDTKLMFKISNQKIFPSPR